MTNHSKPNLVHSTSITDSDGRERVIEIWVGDIASVTDQAPVDFLVLSAFPNDYVPFPNTVISRLSQLGIDVAHAAADKLVDYRKDWQSWVSKPVDDNPLLKHIVCFEPTREDPPETRVGNVFRTVREFLLGSDPSAEQSAETLRMPLLATGNQQASRQKMLEAILTQGWIHLGAGFPIKKLQLFLHPNEEQLLSLLVDAGIQLEQAKNRWIQDFAVEHKTTWDLFISYRHADVHLLQPLLDELKNLRKNPRLFIDKNELTPGGYWKQDLIAGLSRSRKALCFITDEYPGSAACMDEFNASVLRNHSVSRFLIPILNLKDKSISRLPESIQRVHCIQTKLPDQEVKEIAQQVFHLFDA